MWSTSPMTHQLHRTVAQSVFRLKQLALKQIASPWRSQNPDKQIM
jgi:hypothetical protein